MRPTARPDSPTARRKQRSRPTPKWLLKGNEHNAVATNRVMMVLSVLSGEKPVSAAVTEAKISRGFYYQLETKAIHAMLRALAPGTPGKQTNETTLTDRIRELEQKLAKTEIEKRRAERLLFVTRNMSSRSIAKTARARQPKRVSSTDIGPTPLPSSAKTKATKAASSTPTQQVSSIPRPGGANEDR